MRSSWFAHVLVFSAQARGLGFFSSMLCSGVDFSIMVLENLGDRFPRRHSWHRSNGQTIGVALSQRAQSSPPVCFKSERNIAHSEVQALSQTAGSFEIGQGYGQEVAITTSIPKCPPPKSARDGIQEPTVSIKSPPVGTWRAGSVPYESPPNAGFVGTAFREDNVLLNKWHLVQQAFRHDIRCIRWKAPPSGAAGRMSSWQAKSHGAAPSQSSAAMCGVLSKAPSDVAARLGGGFPSCFASTL